MTLYTVVWMHAVNIMMCLINLCGLETKLCNSNMVCCFLIFEIMMLVWIQVSYFNSQSGNCLTGSTTLYLWTMGQILAIYLGMGIIVCHFFRKFCQDNDEQEVEGQEGDDSDLELQATTAGAE